MDWFKTWFNTPYYHLLYKNRDEIEAENFIKNLFENLAIDPSKPVMDLACGKGRHSIFINKLGYQVVGLDLSSQSIEGAKKFENDSLKFHVQDMREVFKENHFGAIFNLFTSFGYFEDHNDHFKVFESIKKQLLPQGILVIDFMNSLKVIKNLVKQEVKTVENIDFHIKREVKDGFILKHIDFEDKGKKHSYTEKVRALTLEDFLCFAENDFSLLKTFGNFNLNPFDKTSSDRLIMVFQLNDKSQ